MPCVDVPSMLPLRNGRRHKCAFLVHGKILMASCSSNEVGTTYFYLRWEERSVIHNTLCNEQVSGLSHLSKILVNWILVVLPHIQLLLNMPEIYVLSLCP